MLDWLKNVLGDSYTEEIDKQVSAEIGRGFVAKVDFNAANEAKKAAEAQLATANKTIDGYKTMDIEGIRKSAEEYKAAAEKAQKDADARVASVQFDAALDAAIGKAHGRNAKAVRALLDLDALRGSKNAEADTSAALDALKKDAGYLFEDTETPPPFADGAGTNPMLPTGEEKSGVEKSFDGLNPGLKY